MGLHPDELTDDLVAGTATGVGGTVGKVELRRPVGCFVAELDARIRRRHADPAHLAHERRLVLQAPAERQIELAALEIQAAGGIAQSRVGLEVARIAGRQALVHVQVEPLRDERDVGVEAQLVDTRCVLRGIAGQLVARPARAQVASEPQKLTDAAGPDRHGRGQAGRGHHVLGKHDAKCIAQATTRRIDVARDALAALLDGEIRLGTRSAWQQGEAGHHAQKQRRDHAPHGCADTSNSVTSTASCGEPVAAPRRTPPRLARPVSGGALTSTR